MPAEYYSIEEALESGLRSSGYKDDELRKQELEKLLSSTPKKARLTSFPQRGKELDVYEFNDPEGNRVEIGIGRLKCGLGLWFYNSEKGTGVRN
jgi:hypothetical protein